MLPTTTRLSPMREAMGHERSPGLLQEPPTADPTPGEDNGATAHYRRGVVVIAKFVEEADDGDRYRQKAL